MKKLIYLIVAIAILGLIVPGCIPVVPPAGQDEPEALLNKGPGDPGEVWNLTTTTKYFTIQAAIDVAASGDTIIVGPGTYTEYLHITTDDLTIEGAGIDQSIIDLDGLTPYWHYPCSGSYASRAGVLISGYGSPDEIVENVTFKGFTVKNAGLNPPGDGSYPEFIDPDGDGQDDVRGIVVANGKNISIEYCKVQNSGYNAIGVGKARCTSLKQSEGVTIDNCICVDNWETGISVGSYVGTITITDNICSNNKRPHPDPPNGREYSGKGIEVSGKDASHPISGLISGNICENNGFEGIVLKNYSDGVTIEGNTVTGHNIDDDGAGIFFYGKSSNPANCKNNVIRNNTVTGNIRGIVAYYAQECTIEGNIITTDSGTFAKGQAAIKIDGGNLIMVNDNTISCDGVGIKVQKTWNDVDCYNNTFIGNTIIGAKFAGVFISHGAHDNTFTCNNITGTTILTRWAGKLYEETQGDGIFLWGYSGKEAGPGNVFHNNCIFGNADDGMENQTTTEVDAECNWWGSHDGPSGLGPGTGDAVSTNVDFDPWIGITDLSGPTDPVGIGVLVSVGYSFTCGTLTATLAWGDGYVSTLSNNSGTETHAYSDAGVYIVTLTIENSCGSYSREFQYVVVYDPTGGFGFVTGGGWIYSPAGAYVTDPNAEGKASFGFVSKYKKGQSTPTGNTEFQFKAGDLNFHSDSYDWLVVANHKAMYKGAGTINGTGDYGFMLSAIDENLTPSTDVDMFRIKIWDKDDGDAVVYDNNIEEDENADPTTEIAGGQIVIHKTK